MYIAENGKYAFTVLEKKFNRRITMKRTEVMKKDPIALIRFYEKNLNISS